jgi:hypothetical protein
MGDTRSKKKNATDHSDSAAADLQMKTAKATLEHRG